MRHFKESDLDCKCCGEQTPHIRMRDEHMNLLDTLVDRLGFDLVINSAYRCPVHNRRIGGAPNSWHLRFATDVAPADGDDEKLDRIRDAAEGLGFTGIGMYSHFVHLDMRPTQFRWRG